MNHPRAIGDRIVVKPDPPEEMVGKIHIPEKAQETPLTGVIVDVGPGRLLESGERGETDAAVGERVWFAPFSASMTITWDGVEYLVLREEDLLAIEPAQE